MAGCSKKQYAIMMSAGSEGKKLASEMGSMDQDKFDAAFSELLGSGNYKSQDKSEKTYSRDDDEDYREFDAGSEDDFGFDEDNDNWEVIDDKKGIRPYYHDFINQRTITEENDGTFSAYEKGKWFGEFNSLEEAKSAFDNKEEKESSPMNEFSGPDIEGPSYAQLDELKKYADRYGYNFDEIKNEFDRRVKDAKEKQGFRADKDAMAAAFESLTDDMVEANGKDFINKPQIEEQYGNKYHFEESENGEEPIDLSIDEIKDIININMIGEKNRANVDRFLKGAGLVNDEDRKAVLNALGYNASRRRYNITDSEGQSLGEIEASSEEEAFNIASKKFPGRGDELFVDEAEEDINEEPKEDKSKGTISFNGATFPDLKSFVEAYGEEIKKWIK